MAMIGYPPGSTGAFNVQLTPSFDWKLLYEDNVYGVAEGGQKTADFSNRYKPKLEGSINFSRVSINAQSTLNIIEYTKEKDWNTVDQNYSLAAIFKLNHRSKFQIAGNYQINTDTTRYFQSENGTPTGILVSKFENKTKSALASYSNNLSAKSLLRLSFAYMTFDTLYSSGSDFCIYSLFYKYTANKKDTLSISLGYNDINFKFPGGGNFNFKMNTYSISGGVDHTFSQNFTLNFSMGLIYLETKFNKAVFEEDPTTGQMVFVGSKSTRVGSTGSSFSLSLEKKFSYTGLQLSAGQNVSTNPDTGETTQNTNLRFIVDHKFTHKLKGSIDWAFYSNTADAGEYNNARKYDQQSFATTAQISYAFNRRVMITMQYSKIDYKDKSIFGYDTKRNDIALRVSFRPLRPFMVR
ncbi:MAG: hypothetical protein NTZ51_02975 [Proteobacteria bacterium]|nr:hypothetical protein [Pseudomonadota bacterium]